MAGRIPDRTVRDIVEQTDMVSVVSEVVELRRAGSSLKGLCPFHNEKSPSFNVNPANKLYHCYGCGAGGDVIRFVQETRGLSFIEAIEFLGERAGVRVEREAATPEEVRRALAERSARGRMLELNRAAQAYFQERFASHEGEAARTYAADRGLSADTIERFGLGAATNAWADLVHHLLRKKFHEAEIAAGGLGVARDSGGLYDRFRDRLMFPIYTAAGDLVGFGGRALGGGKEVAKYLNSPETTLDSEAPDSRFRHFYKKGQCVFGLHQARETLRRTKTALIVEGNIDVMTLHQAGFTGAVCAMGTALTDMQVREIKRFAEKVSLVFDGDSAGRKAAMKAVPVCIAEGLEGTFVVLPQGEDPDSYVRRYGQEAFARLVREAPHLLTGYIDGLIADSDGSLQSKAEVLQKAGPLLASIASPLVRDMARDHLGARLLERGSEENRATLQRYLSRLTPAPVAAQAAEPLPPDPTWGEPPIPPIEEDLGRVLVWYPALLAEAARAGALELISHDGMRLALRDLLGHCRDEGIDGGAVAAWAQHLADGVARRAVLRWLVDAPLVPADHARSWLEQVLARLQARGIEQAIESVKAALSQAGQPDERLADLSRQLVQLRQQKEHAREALRRTGQPP